MRYAALILSSILNLALAASAVAAPTDPPPLRYSVEIPPGEDGTPPAAAPLTPVQTQQAPPVAAQTHTAYAKPVANPPLRYSIESEGAPPPSQPAAQPAPQSRYTAGKPPLSAPVHRIAVTHPAERVTVTGRRPGYRLGPGDKVHVTVYGEGDLSGDFEVSGSGRIAFPLIGDVTAAGLTAPGLGAKLTTKLAAGYLLHPRVSVEVVTYRPFYIIGQVNKPGSYPYTDGMTAVNAIALAGGFTAHAAESDVYIRHEGQAKEIEMPANASTLIKPGDVVRVSESGFWSVVGVLQPVTSLIGAARYGFP